MLLAPPSPTDLPAEALLARLRARRAGLELSGAAGGGPAPAEFIDWLAPRLGRALWEALRPCLEIEAMHLLLLALRLPSQRRLSLPQSFRPGRHGEPTSKPIVPTNKQHELSKNPDAPKRRPSAHATPRRRPSVSWRSSERSRPRVRSPSRPLANGATRRS